MKFSFNGTNIEFRIFRSNLVFLFQQFYYNVKQQYQDFLKIFNMTTRGICNFICGQKLSIGTLFCQQVTTRTFSYKKEALYTG